MLLPQFETQIHRGLLLLGLVPLALALGACSGGGGGGSGGTASGSSDNVSISGHVRVTSTSSIRRVIPAGKMMDAQDDTTVPYAHVNLCEVSASGSISPIPGTSTVVADSSGTFTLSIGKSQLTNVNRAVVCVSSPAGDYEMYALIPQDLLPTQANQITTISIDATGESTVLTLFLCSQTMLSLSASKGCQILNQDYADLIDALDGQGGTAPTMPLSSAEWDSLFSNNGQSTGSATQFQSAIEAWGEGQGFNSGWMTWGLMSATPSSANTFSPVQPITDLISKTDPSGAWSGSFSTAGPGPCVGMSGSWTATIIALGNNVTGTWSASAGGGGALSGNTTDGALTYQVGGSGGASFGGAISGGGLAIGGSWSGGTHCVGGGVDYGATYGSFAGGRN